MRRIAAMALTTVALLLTAACDGSPVGEARDRTAGRSAPAVLTPPAPSSTVPPARACYDAKVTRSAESPPELPPPVPCTALHTVQTVQIGEFGTDVVEDAPPPADSPAGRGAYAVCADAAGRLLGDDWRTGRVDLRVVPPTSVQWRAGARWYRCDLVELADVNDMVVVRRRASLSGALKGRRPAGIGCLVVKVVNATARKTAIACSRPHNLEFVGITDPAPGPYPVDPGQLYTLRYDGCRKAAAAFVGVPNDATFKKHATVLWNGFGDQQAWESGNRGSRCYVVTNPERSVTHSLKGMGRRARPLIFV